MISLCKKNTTGISCKQANDNDFFELKHIETVLFDKDGTFIDLHYFWGKMTELRVTEVIKTFGLSNIFFEKLCLCLGYDIETKKMLSDGITAMYSRSKIIEIFGKDLANLGVKTTETKLTEIFDFVNSLFYQDMQEYTKPIDSAIEFVKKVRENGCKTAVVTSDTKESTLLTLKQFGWEGLFDVVVGRECSNQTKESGALTSIALAQLCSNPQNTVMIGDAPMDFVSAQNANVGNVILVATGQITSQDLKQTTSFVVESLDEIEIVSVS